MAERGPHPSAKAASGSTRAAFPLGLPTTPDPERPLVTPLEILRMGLSMYGIKRSDADAWCLKWLERFSVDGTGKRRMRASKCWFTVPQVLKFSPVNRLSKYLIIYSISALLG